MSREILQNIITDFDLQRFKRFFSEKNRKFRPSEESLNYYSDEIFSDGKKLGEISFEDGNLLVCVFEVKKELTERSGKKAQYDLGKKILKETQTDAGIFIFYNKDGRFRFSLIYTNYLGQKRDWSAFRRFTYFVSSDPQVTNKTFLQRIGDGDFSSLENVKETFSVEKVTKDFFKDIANWYFWAVKHVHFPKDAPKEADGHDHVGVIRMITRLIFCWFVKEKGLIPGELFDQRRLDELLDGFSPDKDDEKDSVFYKAILQNLFFATLNTEMDKRAWARDGQNFMAHSLYRYSDLFKKPNEALSLFRNIPFLNGGLFECLDKDLGKNAKTRYVRIDGFSRRTESQPVVPDFLFFGPEREEDLSAEYGNRKFKRVMVRGLIHTLRQYHFTIEENTPIEQEVALDPELSGKVFENLLAAYNPETGATARKQTGSFYTPREIVDYMVDEVVIAYLKMKLEANQSSTDNIEERLRHLFAYNDEDHLFSTEEVDILIDAIDHLKALDPAVGSGAFPMGILHKLVFILGKLDPRNEQWKQRQIRRVSDAIAAAEKIEDSAIRERTVKELEQQITGIEEAFERNELDYGRKLYLIENCLYGVDIQSIAVQIAKMRFFISLIVDQRVDPDAANLGVRPLPNLETKFVAANTLIGIEKPKQMLLRNTQIDAKEAELRRVREKHFIARTLLSKEKCREQDKQLRAEIAELLKSDGWGNRIAKKLAGWDPYDQNASAPFFDPEWMFGVRDGFDMVIANPPYVGEKGHKELFREIKKSNLGKFYQGKMDLFYFFFHLALNIAEQNGNIAFITTNYFQTATGAKTLRKDFKDRATIFNLVNFNELKIFESALGQHNMITILQKGYNKDNIVKTCITKRKGFATSEILQRIVTMQDIETDYFQFIQEELYDGDECYIRLAGNTTFIDNPIQRILEKVKKQGDRLDNVCNINSGADITISRITEKHLEKFKGNFNKMDGVFVLSAKEAINLQLNRNEQTLLKQFIKNSDIYKYGVRSTTDKLLYLKWEDQIDRFPNIKRHLLKFKQILEDQQERYEEKYPWFALHRPREQSIFEAHEKIVVPYRSKRNVFGYTTLPVYSSRDVFYIINKDKTLQLKYILALLNSKLYYPWLYHRGKRKGETLELYQQPLAEIPIKIIPEAEQKTFIRLVNQILLANKDDPEVDTTKWEQEIDQLVYKLYGLTEDEIAIVEGKSS